MKNKLLGVFMNIMIFALICALFSGINVYAQDVTFDESEMTSDVLKDLPEFSIAIPDDIKKELEELRKKQEQEEQAQQLLQQSVEGKKFDSSIDDELNQQAQQELENYNKEENKQQEKQEQIFEEFVG